MVNIILYKNIALTLIIVLIPNISFYILAKFLDLERVWLNVDYFLPLAFLAFNRKWIYILTFISIAVIDFLLLFGQIFPIIRLGDLFYILKFSWVSSSVYKLYGVLVISLVFSEISTTYKIYNQNLNKGLLIVFNITILIYAVTINIIDADSNKGKFWKPKNSMVSSLAVDYYNYYNSGFIDTYDLEGNAFDRIKSVGATASIWKNEGITAHDKVMLIINESWGEPNNAYIQEDILSPLLSNEKVKNVERDVFGFQGFTIAGELRELCQKRPVHFNLKNQKTGFEDCLPHYYKDLGYKTVAVHGAVSYMYDRTYWYPRVGFEELLFRDNNLNLPNSRCFSFPGNCDKDIASVITTKFQNNEKLFLYWLTLNTHSIYDNRDLYTDLFDCNDFDLRENSYSCNNLKLQKQFFHTLSNMVNDAAFKGTKVIVVSDHEPPIAGSEEPVFYEGRIPYVSFTIE